jgi:hypothetical protein
LVEQILKLGPKVNIYDKDLFKKHVNWKEQRFGNTSIMGSIKSMLVDSHSDRNWDRFLGNVYIKG